ncbi:MAG TPA: pyrroline-5-carboxylate reductase [Candidatus Alistipes cottocaccae]|nr:pyrroline-5-carboxylate reductase [Candidatus Alistipes cottocaccae]
MNIGFIGFGNMARALAGGLVRGGAVGAGCIGACARDRAKLQRNTEPFGFRAFDTAAEVAAFADVVVIAVKPYQVEAVVAPVREQLKTKIVVSVAAGVTFDDYERMLAPGTAHLSTCPNTPVAVCEGIVVFERRHSLSDVQLKAVTELFSHVGLVLTVDTPLLGMAGTICGCSPAFVAMFIEALSDAAVKHGIPRADACRMVSQMVVGTGRLQLETGQHPGAMKDAVCSPGGTTIVGVGELEQRGFRGAVIAAIDAIDAKINKK